MILEDPQWRHLLVMATMFFPQDEKLQHSLIESMMGKAASIVLEDDDDQFMELAAKIQLLTLAQGASGFDELRADALRLVKHNRTTKSTPNRKPLLAGSVAANALLIPFLANMKYGRSDVGLHHAFRIILGTRDKEDPAGLRTLQSTWRLYEPAAHLWAAWELVGHESFCEPDLCAAFLSLAEIVRKWGEQFTPLRANRPILNAALMWTVPKSWTVPIRLNISELSMDEEWLDLLGK